MTDNTTQEEERGSRSAVSVAAERAKQRLVQLDEQEKGSVIIMFIDYQTQTPNS